MAQFAVHRNPGRQKDAIPFVVVVQSTIYDDSRRRVVVPLVRKTSDVPVYARRLNPAFVVDGITVVLHPIDIGSVPEDKLGEPVASLAAHGDAIIGALDELITRAYG